MWKTLPLPTENLLITEKESVAKREKFWGSFINVHFSRYQQTISCHLHRLFACLGNKCKYVHPRKYQVS